jgi:hypothetical protein
MRWLTALGVTHSSSLVCVTLRSRAKASKVSRHWMGGMRIVMGGFEHVMHQYQQDS